MTVTTAAAVIAAAHRAAWHDDEVGTRPIRVGAPAIRAALKTAGLEGAVDRVSSGRSRTWVWLTDERVDPAVAAVAEVLRLLWNDADDRIYVGSSTVVVTRAGWHRTRPATPAVEDEPAAVDAVPAPDHADDVDVAEHAAQDAERAELEAAELAPHHVNCEHERGFCALAPEDDDTVDDRPSADDELEVRYPTPADYAAAALEARRAGGRPALPRFRASIVLDLELAGADHDDADARLEQLVRELTPRLKAVVRARRLTGLEVLEVRSGDAGVVTAP